MAILWEEIKLCILVVSRVLRQVPSMATKMGFVFMLFSHANQNGYKVNVDCLHMGLLAFWV